MVLEQKAWVPKCVFTVVELSTAPKISSLNQTGILSTPTQSRKRELRSNISTVKEAVKKGSV